MLQSENMAQIIFGSILMSAGIIIFLRSGKLKDRTKTFFQKNDLKCGLLFISFTITVLGLYIIFQY